MISKEENCKLNQAYIHDKMETEKNQIIEHSLLEKLKKIIKDNLQNEQFGVEELSSEIGMSRSNLHRKLKMLKDQSVSQYIRQVRLEEAMTLLKKGEGNSSEVAYQVGFNSTSYFSTCFQQHYGFTPGEVIKNTPGINYQVYQESKPEIKNITSTKEGISNKPNAITKYKYPLIGALGFIIILIVSIYFYPKFITYWQTPKSIAMLPLEHLSPDQELAYLTEGIHNAMIGALGNVSNLRVISRTSTLKYASNPLKMAEIAKELGVDAIVEGSVRVLDKDSIRLQLRLVDVNGTEEQIWSREYYEPLDQILQLQGNATKEIANSINISLRPEERERLSKTRKVDPETYKYYLRGMHYLNKSSQEDFNKGLEFLHKAVDMDPAEPFAHAGLAYGYVILGHSASASNDAFIKAKAAALQAIKLDPDLLEAHAALACIHLYYEWDWEAAEKKFEYINSINPSITDVHYDYSWYLYLMERKNEAIREHEIVVQLDPLSPKYLGWTSYLYSSYGNFEKANEYAEKALAINPESAIGLMAKGVMYEEQNKNEKALIAYDNLCDLHPEWINSKAPLYAKMGKNQEIHGIIKHVQSWPNSSWKAHTLSVLYASLGDIDNTIKWLRYKPHHAYIPWARVTPVFLKFANEPKFKKFLSDLNLPPNTIQPSK